MNYLQGTLGEIPPTRYNWGGGIFP